MVIKGKIVRMESFGAFVEIGAERPGLVHISEMSHGYVRQPSDVVQEGDEIEAEILDVNRRKKQIKLSMKAVLPEPVEEIVEIVEPEIIEQKDRRTRRKNSGRKGGHSFDEEHGEMGNSSANEIPIAEPDPTAMEIAWREAKERKKEKRMDDKAKRNRSSSQEHDDILVRTLENKING